MKVKQLVDLLKDFKQDAEIKFIDFSFISKGEEKIEYEIEWMDKVNTIYTNGFGLHEKYQVYLTIKKR